MANARGPRVWQQKILSHIGDLLRSAPRDSSGAPINLQPILTAVASGHGVGKSAIVAWLTLWAMSTMPDTKVVITANTEGQLRTKTWPEIAKWHRLLINSHWFEATATSLYAKDKAHEKTWRADAIPWSDTNTEAFAGLHNEGSRLLLIFDEASAIDDKIWEVAQGALTDERTEIIWCVFGNPTQNVGRFRECFRMYAHRWATWQIDSRSVEGTNKIQLEKDIVDYGGEGDDRSKIRVLGQFPSSSSSQLIPSDVVKAAQSGDPLVGMYDAVVIGVDVARFGEDDSVICVRKGKWVMAVRAYHGLDLMSFAGIVSQAIAEFSASGCFVDETGLGAGVVDRLRQLGHTVIGVNFGSRPDGAVGQEAAKDKAAEMWLRMRAWLREGGKIPPADRKLALELEAREFKYSPTNAEIVLERKDDMKKRLGREAMVRSPDRADALALTFAYPVVVAWDPGGGGGVGVCKTEYDPFAR